MGQPRLTPRVPPPEIEAILAAARTVAVVGWSARAERPSHWIAAYLAEAGYRVHRVNPVEAPGSEALPVLATLAEIGAEIDVVDVFRAPQFVPEVVAAASAAGAKVVWMQPGAENEAAAARVRELGMTAVVGRCLYADHRAWKP